MTLLPSAFHFQSSSASPSSSSSSTPPPGTHLIISDTPQASAEFALYSLVAGAIREKRPVTIVDFQARGRLHWESVGKKIGTPLPPKTSSSLEYLAPDSLFDRETDEPTLAGLWDELVTIPTASQSISSGTNTDARGRQGTDEPQAQGGMILLVGFSELVWQGFEPDLLSRFTRALMGHCRQASLTKITWTSFRPADIDLANPDLPTLLRMRREQTGKSLITHLHAHLLLSPSSLADHLAVSPSTDPELDLLLRLLKAGQDGGVWWRIEELRSGRSGVVHGEISVHPLSGRSAGMQKRVPYTSPLQYRLDDNVVRVFPKGTGRGYL